MDISITATDAKGLKAMAMVGGIITTVSNNDPWINLDGRLNAPASSSATGQQAALLNGYTSSTGAPSGRYFWPSNAVLHSSVYQQPQWHVAGIDYPVGCQFVPTGNPNTMSIPGVSVNTSTHVVSVTGNNVTINGFDFSAAEWSILITGNNATITNNKFVRTNNTGSDNIIGIAGSASGTVIRYNYLDAGGAIDFPLLFNGVTGLNTVEYNYIQNTGSDNMSFAASNNTIHLSLVFRYNFCYTLIDISGAHADLYQTGSGIQDSVTVNFNTFFCNANQGTQGLGTFDGAGGPVTTAEIGNNTFISPGAVGSGIDYIVSNRSGFTNGPAYNVHDNYVDPTDFSISTAFWDTGVVPSTIGTCSGNTRLTDGTQPTTGWNK